MKPVVSSTRISFALGAVVVSVLVAALSMPLQSAFGAPASYGLNMEELASGGPFQANRRSVQRFSGQFEVTPKDLSRPMVISLHNGIGGTAGFSWLRVFLCGEDVNVASLGRNEEPRGDLLLDDTDIQKHVINLDITDQVASGVNTIVIEGHGPKGALLSWSLLGRSEPRISRLNPSRVKGGSRLTLHGSGFSSHPSLNSVTFGEHEAEVLDASRSSLTIRVPKHIPGGDHPVRVASEGVWSSEPFRMSVTSTPRVDSVHYASPGQLDKVIVNGANFSVAPSDNKVFFDSQEGQVIESSPSRLVVMIPAEIVFEGDDSVRVSVEVSGVPAGAVYLPRSER